MKIFYIEVKLTFTNDVFLFHILKFVAMSKRQNNVTVLLITTVYIIKNIALVVSIYKLNNVDQCQNSDPF